MTKIGVEVQLLQESVKQLDLTNYCLVTSDTTVRDTIETMRVLHRHCAFIVGEKTHLIGILTERDVLKKVINHPETWDEPVTTVMTKDPIFLSDSATAADVLRQMDKGRFRNVPILTGKQTVIGNVTHFALLDYLVAHFPQAVYNLPPDPDNYADERDGG